MSGFTPLDLGQAPGDGTGDTMREAGDKLNGQLEELFERVAAIERAMLDHSLHPGVSTTLLL